MINGTPSGSVSSNATVKLVYKKKACPVDKPTLPNTGVTSNLAAIIFGSLLLVSSLLLVKSSKGRKFNHTLRIRWNKYCASNSCNCFDN